MTLLDAVASLATSVPADAAGSEQAERKVRQESATRVLMSAVLRRLREEEREASGGSRVDALLPLSAEELTIVGDALARHADAAGASRKTISRIAYRIRECRDQAETPGVRVIENIRCALVEELRTRNWEIGRSKRVCNICQAEIDDQNRRIDAYWSGPEGQAVVAGWHADNEAARERFLKEEAERGN